MNRKQKNAALIEHYPWIARIRHNGSVDLGYTLLDELEPGWMRAFGVQMQEELRVALENAGLTEEYGVICVKEKWGQLDWRDYGGNEETDAIVDKYSMLSSHICVKCGKPDVPQTTTGWVLPICRECFNAGSAETPGDYEDAVKGSDDKLVETGEYTWRLFNGENVTRTFDYSKEAAEIRVRWTELSKSD